MISFSVLLAVAIDWLAGEPKRGHPLVGFGALAARVERGLNAQHFSQRYQTRQTVRLVRAC